MEIFAVAMRSIAGAVVLVCAAVSTARRAQTRPAASSTTVNRPVVADSVTARSSSSSKFAFLMFLQIVPYLFS